MGAEPKVPDPEALLASLRAANVIDHEDRARLAAILARGEGDPREALLAASRRVQLAQLARATIEVCGRDEWSVPGYALLAPLGHGATGSVFSALSLVSHELVAIKMLAEHTADDPSTLPRIRRELAVVAELDHEGLPWYGELGTTRAGTVFYPMKLIAAPTLDSAIDPPNRCVDERTVWRVLARVGRVLEHLAERGVVHRDVKPANILIDDQAVWLCDLGLAIKPGSSVPLTADNVVIGSPSFMSPEHAFGDRDLLIASDVYSLGATAYYAASGILAIDGESTVDILINHDRQPVVSIRQHRPNLSPALEIVLDRMLAKPLADRPTPTWIAEVAETWLGQGPAVALARIRAGHSGAGASTPGARAPDLSPWHVLLVLAIAAAAAIAWNAQ